MKGFMAGSVVATKDDLKRANRIGNLVAGIVISLFGIALLVVVLL